MRAVAGKCPGRTFTASGAGEACFNALSGYGRRLIAGRALDGRQTDMSSLQRRKPPLAGSAAAESARALEQSSSRAVTNASVCEGCGDCSRASNCLPAEPLEIEFDRERKIRSNRAQLGFILRARLLPELYPGRLKRQAPLSDEERARACAVRGPPQRSTPGHLAACCGAPRSATRTARGTGFARPCCTKRDRLLAPARRRPGG